MSSEGIRSECPWASTFMDSSMGTCPATHAIWTHLRGARFLEAATATHQLESAHKPADGRTAANAFGATWQTFTEKGCCSRALVATALLRRVASFVLGRLHASWAFARFVGRAKIRTEHELGEAGSHFQSQAGQ
eukprot:623483-Pleurochrysis_carterae.AAC.1